MQARLCESVKIILIITFIAIIKISETVILDRNATKKVLQPNEIVSSTDLNTTELITMYGYSAKNYNVTTEDGYCLTITRIPNTGPVVILVHGTIVNADVWLRLGTNSLPFILFNEGYDVYLVNTRGNKYTEHSRFSSNDREFWNFTFNEIGYYDLPAVIDFALETSQKSQLTYVGHSQGTMVFFVMASLRPEYNNKACLMISMSTLAWMHHAETPTLKALVPLKDAEEYFTKLGIYQIQPQNRLFKFILKQMCPINKFTLLFCATNSFLAFGFDYGQLDYEDFSVQITELNPCTSIKNVLHFAQLVASEDFRQYDYKDKNMEEYGSEVPPTYPVDNITTRIAIMYSYNDWLSSYEDVKTLVSKLPNVVDMYKVPYDNFNHVGYIWGKDAKKLVYDKVISLMEEYTYKT